MRLALDISAYFYNGSNRNCKLTTTYSCSKRRANLVSNSIIIRFGYSTTFKHGFKSNRKTCRTEFNFARYWHEHEHSLRENMSQHQLVLAARTRRNFQLERKKRLQTVFLIHNLGVVDGGINVKSYSYERFKKTIRVSKETYWKE